MNGAMSALRKLAGQSGLPRTLDLSYPSNRYAVGGALVSVLAARALGGTWREAGSVGIGAFAAWATARELDPDHPETATVALPLAAAAGWLGGPGNPVAGLSALSGLRVLGGTVGPNDAALDSLALTAATALCALSGDRAAALAPAGAAALTPGLSQPWPLALALLPAVTRDSGASVPATVLGLGALALSPGLTRSEEVTSKCDQPGYALSAARVQRSRQLAAATLAASVLGGQTRALLPLAASALSVGLRRLNA